MNQIPEFKNQNFFLRSLTHRSYINEHPEESGHNERLEFLGDAVLSFVCGAFLYEHYPDMSEAELTRLRSALVDEKQLTEFAKKIGLGQLMRLGKGAIKEGGRENPSLLSDTFEAMIGAYFLDSGIEAVQDYMKRFFNSAREKKMISGSTHEGNEQLIDAKNRFQQWALATFTQNPEYFIIKESGPDHAKEFVAEVRVNGKVYGSGKGRRKQDATKQAAEDALKNLGLT